jgi:hypothetical protein
MRLYREYYNELTPHQRREYLTGRFDSPGDAERRLKKYAAANRTRTALLGKRDLRSSEIERAWKHADDFLTRAEDYAGRMDKLRAGDASAAAQKEAQLLAKCRELREELKRTETRIKRTPYNAAEQARLLERNNYYISRLHAVHERISKSE